MRDHRAAGSEHHVGVGAAGCAQAKLHGLAGAVRHLRCHGSFPDQFIGPRLGVGNLPRYLLWGTERFTGGAYRFVRLLGVARFLGVLARRFRQVLRAVAVLDRGAGSLQRGFRQGRAVGSHIGDVALLIKSLRGAHRHLGRHVQLASRLLLISRGDERCRGPSAVRFGLAGSDHVGHTLEIADELLCRSTVEHRHIVARHLAVGSEVFATGQPHPVDHQQLRRELTGVALHRREPAAHAPVARRQKRHPLTLSLDHYPGGDALHPPSRQAWQHLLPEHRRHFIAIEPVEDAPRLLCVDHLAVELAGGCHRGGDRRGCDLVEHHPLDRDLRIEHLDEMPGNRLPLAVLVCR